MFLMFLYMRYNINIFVELEALAMSQHFLLSAKAHTLSERKVMEMTHDQAFPDSPVNIADSNGKPPHCFLMVLNRSG